MKRLLFNDKNEALIEGDELLCNKCSSGVAYENQDNEIVCDHCDEKLDEKSLKIIIREEI